MSPQECIDCDAKPHCRRWRIRDIIRRAMIGMDAALGEARLAAKMLLQVHDELIFEVPEAEVEKTIEIVSKEMEHAAEPAVMLSVPLKVDARAADNWDEAH